MPRSAATTSPARPRRATADHAVPLGSLTQREHRTTGSCESCGENRLTRLAIQLTDGVHVDFVSCHHCEHKGWEQDGVAVPVSSVLARSGRR